MGGRGMLAMDSRLQNYLSETFECKAQKWKAHLR